MSVFDEMVVAIPCAVTEKLDADQQIAALTDYFE